MSENCGINSIPICIIIIITTMMTVIVSDIPVAFYYGDNGLFINAVKHIIHRVATCRGKSVNDKLIF